jgi:cytochrome c-type biogenesis protein CcmH
MSRNRPLIAFTVIALLALLTVACDREPTLEERAFALDRQIMCPVCDGQTIDQSAHEVSRQMRDVVRARLAAGDTDAEVKAYFASRYGERILAAPEPRGFNALVWLAPPAGIALGLGMLALIMRAMHRQPGGAHGDAGESNGAADTGDLTAYLEQVDRDLGIGGEQRPADSQPGRRA